MMSVRPYLAGTAFGLGGSLMTGIGGGLSVFASLIMGGKATDAPMALVMWIATALGLMCSLNVIDAKYKVIPKQNGQMTLIEVLHR